LAQILVAGLDLDDLEAIQDYLKAEKIDEFTVTEPMYWGYLSASGYLDQTDKEIGESYAEVAQQLLDLYFSGEIEYMDDDEKEDLEWLEKIAAGEDPREVE
jgi:wyosine [tRNA(Phe)-imidazoG37] synthetase (radical SAM superfamily)